LPFAPRFQPRAKRMESCRWASTHTVKRGDWIATFELGSSVVLITSSSLQSTPLVSPNEKVHYGQPVLRFASPDSPLPSGE
jgi:phosphatidylserine decarboxylase